MALAIHNKSSDKKSRAVTTRLKILHPCSRHIDKTLFALGDPIRKARLSQNSDIPYSRIEGVILQNLKPDILSRIKRKQDSK
ncbi:hypothetical protein THZB04_50056 [Vibrio owensii]|nr:hypothetical protein THZB04_50056 [Vibrio owensii]